MITRTILPFKTNSSEKKEENTVVFSQLTEFDGPLYSSGYAIKIPLNQYENYYSNNREFHVEAGKYLILNSQQEVHCKISTHTPVQGLCLSISRTNVNHIYQLLNAVPEKLLDDPFNSLSENIRLSEGIYTCQRAPVLKELLKQVGSNQSSFSYSEDLIEEIAFHLVTAHSPVKKKAANLPSLKSTTRIEIMKRLQVAVEYISGNFRNDINIDDLARATALSKYHLIRLFKHYYGSTPYQLVLTLRMKHSIQLLEKGYSIQEVAYYSGFKDARTFRRAFKNFYTTSPSEYIKN